MYYQRDSDWYDTALICLAGHLITGWLKSHPEQWQKYCDTCGQLTISACPSCSDPIRGVHHYASIGIVTESGIPNYCQSCGIAFPWTEKFIAAARELADELSLTEEEREVIKESLPDIAQDSPTGQASAYKLKRLLDKAQKAGSVAASVLYKIAIDYASETTKKILTGP